MEKLTFATEEERQKAIENFDEEDERNSVVDLEKIMNAQVTQEPKPDDSLDTEGSAPIVDDQSKPDDIKKPDAELPETPASDDKPEGDDPTEALKAKLAEKEEFIKEAFGKMDTLRTLEEKVAKMEKGIHQEKKEAEPEVKKELKESKLSDLQKRRAELLQKYPNPEDQLDGEYVSQMNEIQNGMLEEMANIQHNQTVIQEQAKSAAEKADSYITKREQEDYQARVESNLEKQIKEMDKFCQSNPQFKLSKSFNEVEEDYKQYQMSVSKVYFGREPKTVDEINEAMEQVKRRSPGLISRLSASGIDTEPNADLKRYLGACEVWDFWQGYRKDPLTGDFHRDETGKIIPLMRYDSNTGTRVPDTYPTPEAAFNDKAAKEGFWAKQLVSAKIEGAKKAMSAMSQRDGGATELGANETQGGVLKTKDQAVERINEIDEVEAIKMAQAGNPSLLNEYNELAKTIDWPTVDLAF